MHKIFTSKKYLLGSWINTASPIVAEIMSNCGFDFLVFDAEHSAIGFSEAQSLIQAIKAGNPSCKTLIRLPGNNYEETKKYLDLGAEGVIAPLINSAQEAKELIRAVKYPPIGERGVGFGRSHGYGFNFDNYMNGANENLITGIQIEHIKAVENIDSILSVDGVDFAFIGPYDLSASMGITADFENQKFTKAVDLILSKCNAYNVAAGFHVVQPDITKVIEQVEKGFKMIGYSLDITMLGTVFNKDVKIIREKLK